MLHIIKDLTDPYSKYLKDDPVRPNISIDWRFGNNKQIFSLIEQDKITAILCAKFCQTIPKDEDELITDSSSSPNVAVFYSIWSYKPGSGRTLILDSLDKLKQEHKSITKFITLSPKTETARKFHLRNGAIEFRINATSINYEYYFK
jgi:hypothetical protein